MGTQRPKRLLHGGVDRAKIVMAANERKPGWMSAADWEAELAQQCLASGCKPSILVWCRTGDADQRRDVKLMLKHSKVEVREEVENGTGEVVKVDDNRPKLEGAVTVLRIVGTVEQLEHAYSERCVFNWSYVLSARVGFTAQGSGPEKVRSSGKVKEPKPGKVSLSQDESHKWAREDSKHTNNPYAGKV